MGRLRDRNTRPQMDTARAGAWSRDLAHRRLDSFLRANLAKLALVALGVGALSAVLWSVLSPWGSHREFVLGAFVTACWRRCTTGACSRAAP